MAAVAWVNGRFVSVDEPAIAVTDRGFLFGEGLFETMRAYGGDVFRLRQHLERLAAGAAELGIPTPSMEHLVLAIAQALVASRGPFHGKQSPPSPSDASVRLTLTPGPAGAAEPTLVVLVRPLVLPSEERYRTGSHAVTVPAAMAGGTPLRRIKSLNYLDKLLAQRHAERVGAHEAILVDPDGCVVEGAMRNVFAVLSGTLVTPPLSRGLLAGITRAVVIELALQHHLRVEERDLPVSELLQAEECFLTSSLAELLPVASVDGTLLPSPGPVTQLLTTAYRNQVQAELAQ